MPSSVNIAEISPGSKAATDGSIPVAMAAAAGSCGVLL